MFMLQYYQKKFDEILKIFANTYKFPNHYSNKFVLLLRKCFNHMNEYMEDWEKFNETSLPEKGFLQSLKHRRY